MTFSDFGLMASSLKVLAAGGIKAPTPIQAQAIPPLLDGKDVVGQANTGSGKTLAFGLPLIESIDPDCHDVQAIVLTPTRELAQQVGGVLASLARPAKLSVLVLYGGVGYEPQIEALRRGAQIVIGTPGRVLDHLRRQTLWLDGVHFLVLDEADQMLDQGFARDVEKIVSTTPKTRQTALFSATEPEWVKKVSAGYLRQPVHVRVGASIEAAPEIDHSVVEVWNGDKLPVLLSLLSRPSTGGTLVFGRTKYGVMGLARRLKRLGYECDALQGDLGQATRDRIVKRFRDGELPILLATNVAARGLDMLNIDHVINYDLPESSELFVHRVGRTGRMGRSGFATTLITVTDLAPMQAIERSLGKKLPRIPADQVLARWPARPPAPVAPVAPPPARPVVATVTGEAEAPAKRRRRRRAPAAPHPAPGFVPAVAGA